MYIINGVDVDGLDMTDGKDVMDLIKLIKQECFNSLSTLEQDKVVEKFIELILSDDMNKLGIIKSNGNSEFKNLLDIYKEMGKEEFKKMVKQMISKGIMNLTVLDMDELKNLSDKIKDGTITEDEMEALKVLFDKYHSEHSHSEEEINFSAFAILSIYAQYFKNGLKNESNGSNKEDLSLIEDSEPFIISAYIATMASLISNLSNPIGKMFKEQGSEKTFLSISNVSNDIIICLIDYCKEHNISPEYAILGALNFVRFVMSSIDTNMYYEKDNIEDILTGLAAIVFEETLGSNTKDKNKHTNEKTNGSKNESNTKSANADNKESKNNNDIKKLLFDD